MKKYVIFTSIILSIILFFASYKILFRPVDEKFLNLSDKEISKTLLNDLKEKKFKLIEDRIDLLRQKKVLSKNGTKKLDDFYDSLDEKKLNLELLEEWCKNTSHYSAYLLRGIYYIEEGWRIRGQKYAIYVSKKQFREFHEKLGLAKDSLEEAFRRNPEDPYISVAMMMVCRGLSLGNDTFELWYSRGISADPSSHDLYRQKYFHLLPKWGGSWKETCDFVDSMSKNTPKGSLAYLLYLEVMREALYYQPPRQYLGYPSYEQQLTKVLAIEKRLHSEFPQSELDITLFERLKGGFYFMLDNPAKAETSFRKMIEVSPNNDWPWYMLGQMYIKSLRKPKEAVEFFNEAIKRNPAEKMYYDERGIAADQAGLTDLCISDLTRAINTASSFYNQINWVTYYHRGNCYLSKGNYLDAIQDLSKAHEMSPENYIILYKRSEAYHANKDIEKAIDDLKFVMATEPSFEFASDHIKEYENELAGIKKKNNIK